MAGEPMYRDRLDAAVLVAIDEHPAVHVVDLADCLDEHPVTVDQACARLHDDGCIRPSDYGRYALTDDGRRRLDRASD